MRKKHIIPMLLFVCSILSVPVPAEAGIFSLIPWKRMAVVSVAVTAIPPSVRNPIVFGSGWLYSGFLRLKGYFMKREAYLLKKKLDHYQKNTVPSLLVKNACLSQRYASLESSMFVLKWDIQRVRDVASQKINRLNDEKEHLEERVNDLCCSCNQQANDFLRFATQINESRVLSSNPNHSRRLPFGFDV